MGSSPPPSVSVISNPIGARRRGAGLKSAPPRWYQLRARLGDQELRRRLVHFIPGLLAFSFIAVPRLDPMRLWAVCLVALLGVVVPVLAAFHFRRFFHRHPEEDSREAILGFGIPCGFLLVCFPGQIELLLATVLIVSFGDGSATFAGLVWPGRRLPWNVRKSWVGAAAFLLMGTAAASLGYWLEARPSVPFSLAFACVAPVAALAAWVETLPLPWNDNATVTVTAALGLIASHAYWIGWP